MRRQALTRQPAVPPRDRQALARSDPRLSEGVALYNHHRFFESHEVLEQAWRQMTDRSKDFYKGLIQAAVACYHWSKDNRPGAVTLARSAAHYLKRYRPVYLGLDVEQFLAQFSDVFGWLRRHRLRYDPHLIPVMRWANTRPTAPTKVRLTRRHPRTSTSPPRRK